MYPYAGPFNTWLHYDFHGPWALLYIFVYCLYIILYICCAQSLSHVQLFVTLGWEPARLLCPWNFPGNNTGVGCHFFLQGIFPTQKSNPCLLHWQADSLPLHHLESHNFIYKQYMYKILFYEGTGVKKIILILYSNTFSSTLKFTFFP